MTYLVATLRHAWFVCLYQYNLLIFCLFISAIDVLFAEELGLVFETSAANEQQVVSAFQAEGATCMVLGHSAGTGQDAEVGTHFYLYLFLNMHGRID